MKLIPVKFLFGFAFFISCNNATHSNIINADVTVNGKKNQHKQGQTNSWQYDLAKPSRSWKLPESLKEVSGNTWIDKDHLVLIEDLNTNLYYININGDKAVLEKTIPFAKQDKEKIDIEDVAFVNNDIYALWSHGILFKISNWLDKPQVTQINTGLTKKNNTEGVCYDPVTKQMLIACKDRAGLNDEKKSAKAVFQFDIDKNKLSINPFLVIHKKDFEEVADQKLEFSPSAIAVHPVTYDIYILSTRDSKGMVVYTHDGKIRSFQFINKEIMPQPEGICFSPEGKLYISSEGKKGEAGNLFEFDPR